MTEGSLLTNETIECWCAECKQRTPHALVRTSLNKRSIRHEYKCAFNHKHATTAEPKINYTGATPSESSKQAIDLARHLEALDGYPFRNRTEKHGSGATAPQKARNK